MTDAEAWRLLDGTLNAWFDAPSHSAGATLVERIAHLARDADVRAMGVRLTATTPERAQQISEVARELGLAADPTALQQLHFTIDAAAPSTVTDFWRTALRYDDPSHRVPHLTIRQLDDPRPLRNRIHVDLVRDAAIVDEIKAATDQQPYGAYGLTLADPEGNEVDLVPGDELASDAADWRTNFGAMVCYPTTSTAQANQLTSTAAKLADDVGVPLLIDVRGDGVTIDSGKDQWEEEIPTGGTRFLQLAKAIQTAAHDLGLTPDPQRPRFVQFGIDAVEVEAVRAFWLALLGYVPDPRTVLSDIYDPRRLNPVLFFQPLDASDGARRRQRNRIRFELVVPDDHVQTRVDAALQAGGQIVSGRLLADPEGNEVELRS
jgi:hypothetical protein